MLNLNYPLEGLRGADYNPRKITEVELAKLRESVTRFGIVKPIIAKTDGLIVAGHQRTKALRALGINHGPVYILPGDTTTADEVRFNQLHNGTDVDHPEAKCRITDPVKLGWGEARNMEANWLCPMALVRNNIAALILKFGPWGACVAAEDGEVIHCTQYAMACIQANLPLLVYGVPNERKDEYREFLGAQYGRFSYSGIKRNTYIQTLAQLNRLRDVPGTRTTGSRLYQETVEPWLQQNPKARGIDFGSGKGDYAAKERKDGYNLMDVELFRRVVGANAIDTVWVNRAISQVCLSIKKHGLYDFVICDSVFNSVDSVEAETAVATMLGALCKPGGRIMFSGRTMKARAQGMNATTSRTAAGCPGSIDFLDEDGLSGFYRNGEWFFQKYHGYEDYMGLAKHMGAEVESRESGDYWACWGTKTHNVPWENIESAIKFEFELLWPEGKPIGRSADVLAAMKPVYDAMAEAAGSA